MVTNECHSLISKQSTEKRSTWKRVPRPPNAFMLYRSYFLKSGMVPPEVEKRQQNLSRIAGQYWRMLSDSEKAIWFNKAADVREEHHVKYLFYETGQVHRDTDKLPSADGQRGSATKSKLPFSRSRKRRTRTPYCEGMFAALRDPELSSPESQANLVSTTQTFESSLSTTASLSPIGLPHLLPSFPCPTHLIGHESPSTTSDSPVIRGGRFGFLLDSSSSGTPLWDLSPITPVDIGLLTKVKPTLQPVRYNTPFSGLEQLPAPQTNPHAQVPLTLPGSNIFSPAAFPYLSSSNEFNVTDNFAPFNQSLVPLYS